MPVLVDSSHPLLHICEKIILPPTSSIYSRIENKTVSSMHVVRVVDSGTLLIRQKESNLHSMFSVRQG